MKIARFHYAQRDCWGFVQEGIVHVMDGGISSAAQAMALLKMPDAYTKRVVARTEIDDIRLLPPITQATKIVCVGINYGRHLEESGRAKAPYPSLFIRFPDSFVGHGQAVMRPHVSDSLDYEAELAIVIGKHARYIDECHAMEYVGGYTCLAENSVREYQRHGTQVTPGKNFDRSGAIGPWIVTADEVPRPTNLRLRGKLNGETVQSARVSELLFTIPQLIAYASSFTTLRPGDVIATGTPDGVGAARTPPRFLRCGDVFEVEVEGVGLLRNRVAEEETMSAAHVRETVGAR